ncbi:hypothetical protein AVEN_133824-1 [Araneus ventricosus]|uniref:Uncharacterized protein n=1 Tax=Araneus ventricosus TaxID=182803 RepID=A0A4Y2PPT8_ARAVE|nr:hypothetical protein AVEN_255119-1 [Araneus ventricosus]GBN53170.1 hypothetical protein AVEN_133824-1 [Araneus ventricosus]
MFRVVSGTMVLPHLPQFSACPILRNQQQTSRWRKFDGPVLENDSSTTTSLIEDFPKTTASQNILEEISPLPINSNKNRKREKSVQVQRSKLITSRTSKEDLKMKAKTELKSEEEKREGREETKCIICAETFEED